MTSIPLQNGKSIFYEIVKISDCDFIVISPFRYNLDKWVIKLYPCNVYSVEMAANEYMEHLKLNIKKSLN